MNCRHFGVCGGCQSVPGPSGESHQPIKYALELELKEKRVKSLLAAYDVPEWRPIIPSPQEWHYRNKMEYAFSTEAYRGPESPALTLGLRKTGRFDTIVDLETCFLVSPEGIEVLTRTRAWAKENGFTGYDRRRHTGDLRYLVLREAKNTKDRLAIILASHPIVGLDALQKQLQDLLSTCWLGVTDARGDVARADDMRLLWGSGTIDETLNGITYRISPFSFFQTNTRGTERLYTLLKEWATGLRQNPGGALIDLYCGSGGITLALANCFDRVIGIDTNRDAVKDAQANAERNGLATTEFVCEDAMEFLKKLPGSKLAVQMSAMVVDPPRPGLHPKALGALIEMNPQQLAYVSCNPESLARDLQSLVPLYHIKSVQPVDLFPHTTHVETLAILEHR